MLRKNKYIYTKKNLLFFCMYKIFSLNGIYIYIMEYILVEYIYKKVKLKKMFQ